MKGLWLEGGRLSFRDDLPEPVAAPGDAVVRVLSAGVCGTDLELASGLYPFTGVPGHEFVGVVESGPARLCGQRVVADINLGCGVCSRCLEGSAKHCASRRALGIRGHDGAFAERICVPAENLHVVPPELATDLAVLAEPLAAALDIVRQVPIEAWHRVLLVGAGRLGQLIARALQPPTCGELVVAGRGRPKLERLARYVSHTVRGQQIEAGAFDVAIECTGNTDGFALAMNGLAPRGTLVLKSTYGANLFIDATRVVVDELRIIGSRCGPLPLALEMLERRKEDFTGLVCARYPLAEGHLAFERSRLRDALKVLIDMPR